MNGLVISIEGMSPELIQAYVNLGMDRAQKGVASIDWLLRSGDGNFAVARHGGRIVGMSANIRHRMKFDNQTGVGFQAVDSFVDAEMRGQGLFGKMAQAFADATVERQDDLIWGFPNDNAAPAWFGRLGWTNHGQVPFLIKPLRAGYLLRKLRLPGNFPVAHGRDLMLQPIDSVGAWADRIWQLFSQDIGCATIRDAAFLQWRLFEAPHAVDYRVVADPGHDESALVASREMDKHGARIAYVMEAMGGDSLHGILVSELAHLRDRGNEIALAWAYPWSPNYRALRKAGFLPMPEVVRPIRIWFGGRPVTAVAAVAANRRNWYLSYLDSDTV